MSAQTRKEAKTSGDQLAAAEPEVFLYEGGEVAEELKGKITRVRVAPQVAEISDSAFLYCYKLVEVHLNEGMHTIGENAFQDCKVLESVAIPSSVITLGDGAFYVSMQQPGQGAVE